MFSSSRVLAQSTSAAGLAAAFLTDSSINGSGSTPVSAMRPAKIEMILGVVALTASTTSSTCAGVKIVVMLILMPSAESLRTSSAVDSPSVVTHGILTYTLSAHEAISRASASMPARSSAKTSNDTLTSLMLASTSRANAR